MSTMKNIITSNKILKALLNMLAIGVFIGLWQLTATIIKSPFFPDVKKVTAAFIDLVNHGDLEGYSLLTHIEASLIRIGAGFGLACLIGIPLGLLMGLFPAVYDGSRAVIEPIRYIPPIAWIPLIIVLLRGFSRYVFIIWLGAFFPILINTLTSIPRVTPVHINVARVHGADRGYTIRHIVIPSVLPEILAGMRVGLGVGWMCIVAAEMIGGEMVGLGYLILKYADMYRMEYTIVGMVLIGIIGLIMNEVLLQIEKRLFKWRWEVVV
ncbi:MAG: taurine transporter subunit [Candidatus Bathyarchaeota archaeon BA2]|nr:MAG: taurine transporter subunit [Candidatus Bathyarchaeota archaeon BA2]